MQYIDAPGGTTATFGSSALFARTFGMIAALASPARMRILILGLLLCFAWAAPARAQCPPDWEPFDPTTASIPGMNGRVYASTMWDPDGDGPLTAKMVVAGSFTLAVNAVASNIAVYDPATSIWTPLGAGLGGAVPGGGLPSVNALATLSNGDLIAGGRFTSAGGVTVGYIARWDGTAWYPLGSGMNDGVLALTTLPNGDLIAGGSFTAAGGVPANRIARWNGSAWSPLGSGMNNQRVFALTTLPNGDLIAGGNFTTAGGVPANRIARWDGSAWSPLGSGTSGTVHALKTLPSGDLIAGGEFTTAGEVPANRIARWDGLAWSPLGSGISGDSASRVNAVTRLPNGDIIAGGRFAVAGGVAASNIARWDGSGWFPLGLGISGVNNPNNPPYIFALTTLPNGDVIAGGEFPIAGGVPMNFIARWDGSAWSSLGTGMSDIVQVLATLPNGDLIAGGRFDTAGGVPASGIASWDGSAWSPLGSGINEQVYALTTLPNGDLIAGGSISTSGGLRGVARWDGSIWSPLGSQMNDRINSVTTLPNGDLIAGGDFTTASGVPANRVARWNGSVWSALGSGMSGGSSPAIYAFTTLPSGDLIAGGDFTTAGGVPASRIARWNGSAWSSLGSGMTGANTPWDPPRITVLTTLPNGDLIAGGRFTTAGGVPASNIARWNGSAWSSLGSGTSGTVYALKTLPSGGLIAGGIFTTAGGVVVNNIARWDGSAWSPLGSGLRSLVYTLTTLPNGDLIAGGDFTASGTTVMPYIARFRLDNPACNRCEYDFNQDENVDLLDAQQMAQVFVGILTPEAGWLDGDLNGDENADLTDAQLLAAFVVSGTCGV